MNKTVRNILTGMGSVLEIAPPRATPKPLHIQSDEDALRSDWQAVGDNLRFAMQKVAREVEDHAGTLSR